MTRHDTAQPRELSITELRQAGGGANYMKIEGVRGDVTASAHDAGANGVITVIPIKVKHNA